MNKNSETHQRIGLYGGTFNPVHVGHLNTINTVHERLSLDRIVVVPANQNPLKAPVDGPSSEQRLDMLRIGISDYSDFAEIDDRELKRGGISYTVDTIKEYSESVLPENLYFILGMDEFDAFDHWRDYEQILNLANLIVVTRPGHQAPFSAEDLPEGVRNLVAEFERNFIALTTGRHIEFVRLDLDVSSKDVRKRLRTGRSVEAQLTIPVEDYIRQNGLYQPLGPKIGDYEAFVEFCANSLFSRKAVNVRGFDLRTLEAPSEFTLVASGTSTRHTSALADVLVNQVKEEFGVLPQAVEGMQEGRWVLVDYGSLIVHVFYDYVRQEYRVEDLWRGGVELNLHDPAAEPGSVAKS